MKHFLIFTNLFLCVSAFSFSQNLSPVFIWKRDYINTKDSNIYFNNIIENNAGDLIISGTNFDSILYINRFNKDGDKLNDMRFISPGNKLWSLFLDYDSKANSLEAKNYSFYSEYSTGGFINTIHCDASSLKIIDSNTFRAKDNSFYNIAYGIPLVNGNYFFVSSRVTIPVIDFVILDKSSRLVFRDTMQIGDRYVIPRAISELPNGNVVMAFVDIPGSSKDPDQSEKLLLVMLSPDGKIISKKYFNAGSPFGICEGPSNSIIVGASLSTKVNSAKISILSIELNNFVVNWQKEFQPKEYTRGLNLKKYGDQILVLGFAADSGTGKGSVAEGSYYFRWGTSSFYLCKLNPKGEFIESYLWKDNDTLDCELHDIIPTKDGNSVVIGKQIKNYSIQNSTSLLDEHRDYYYIAKLNNKINSVDLESIADFTISPNPASTELSVKFGVGVSNIRLSNVLGGQLSVTSTEQNGVINYDISNLSSGLYFVTWKEKGINKSKKFVVQR